MRILSRAPEDREVADHLGVDVETLWRWQSEVEGSVHISIDQSSAESDGQSVRPSELLANHAEDVIEERLNLTQEVGILREAILGLKEQERTVLSLYYFEELKLHQIATVLELTESRVSQIRSKAISKLRLEMGPLREQVA